MRVAEIILIILAIIFLIAAAAVAGGMITMSSGNWLLPAGLATWAVAVLVGLIAYPWATTRRDVP